MEQDITKVVVSQCTPVHLKIIRMMKWFLYWLVSVSFCLFVCFLTVVQICSEPEQDLECFGSAHLLLLDGLCLWGWGAGSKTRDLEGAPVVTGSPEYMGSSGIHICAPPECAGSIPHQDKTGQVPHRYWCNEEVIGNISADSSVKS